MQHEDNAGAGLSRRHAIAAIGALGAGAVAGPALAQRQSGHITQAQLGWDDDKGEYALPPLPYAYDALEPHIDEQTMRIHHGRHHAGYVAGLNRALGELAKIRAGEGEAALVKHWSRELAFHGSGHVNHALFWLTMAPPDQGGGGRPSGALAGAIDRDFGSFEKFEAHFKAAAGSVEGSGWAWLVLEPIARRLMIMQAEKQQDMASMGVVPLLGVDVWEHAYYLKYQNRRADYVGAFMHVANWGRVSSMYERAMG